MLPDISAIKTRRLKLGLKQKELALSSHVSQSLIAKLESNKMEPSYSVVKRIFIALERMEHKSEKVCSDIMTSPVMSIKKDDSIKKAINLMKSNFISQLPVIDNKSIIGSISESSIFERLVQGGSIEDLFTKPVSYMMGEPFPIVRVDMPISIVLPLLKSSDAILVSKNGLIVGIITKVNYI